MQANSDLIPGSQSPHDFRISPVIKMTGGPITLESTIYSSSPMNPINKDSSSISAPPHSLGPPTSHGSSMTQDSAKIPKRQKKGRVFTEAQNRVLQEHFQKCQYLKKEECTAIAQTLGIHEHHIKIWFKNRRARAKQKKDQEVDVNPAYPSQVRDSSSTKTDECITVSKTSPEDSTNAIGVELKTQSPNIIFEKENDQGSSAIEDQLFLEQLCELEDSLGNLSPPDFFEHFSLLEFF